MRYGGWRLGAPMTHRYDAPLSEMSTGRMVLPPPGPAMRSPKSPTCSGLSVTVSCEFRHVCILYGVDLHDMLIKLDSKLGK